MKTLIVIRHAKAEDSFGKDSDRKLSDKGHKNAATMAQMILEKGYRIDAVFSSTAVRTLQTTDHLASIAHLPAEAIHFFDKLYLADVLAITETLEFVPDTVQTLAIVGHNPGVTNFVNDYCNTLLEGLPTSGVAVLHIDTNDWKQFETAPIHLVESFGPKDISSSMSL